MNNIFSLESSIDSLNQKVDSLNYRLLQLEENAANQELVTESQADGPADSRKITCPNCNGVGTTQETCDKCHGRGSCSYWCNNTGYRNFTCSVCRGKGRINEYE